MNKSKRIISLWGPVVFWCGLIFYLSSVQNLKISSVRSVDEVFRSGAHFMAYAVLYLLVFRAHNFQRKKKDFLLPLIFTFFYGISDEIHQLFVPTRDFQLQDLLVDFGGSALGYLFAWRLK